MIRLWKGSAAHGTSSGELYKSLAPVNGSLFLAVAANGPPGLRKLCPQTSGEGVFLSPRASQLVPTGGSRQHSTDGETKTQQEKKRAPLGVPDWTATMDWMDPLLVIS